VKGGDGEVVACEALNLECNHFPEGKGGITRPRTLLLWTARDRYGAVCPAPIKGTLRRDENIFISLTPSDEARLVLLRRLEAVTGALVDNAARYGPKGEPVTLSSATPDGELNIEVRDRGPGIPEKEHRAGPAREPVCSSTYPCSLLKRRGRDASRLLPRSTKASRGDRMPRLRHRVAPGDGVYRDPVDALQVTAPPPVAVDAGAMLSGPILDHALTVVAPFGEHPPDDFADAMGGFPVKRPPANVPVHPQKSGSRVGESPVFVG
jgi:hypothetical protein